MAITKHRANSTSSRDGSRPYPSAERLNARLRRLYPGIDMDGDDDVRAGHVREIHGILHTVRENVKRLERASLSSAGSLRRTLFGMRVLNKIRSWKAARDMREAAASLPALPTHEQILAYKLLTRDGDHPASTVAALRGTEAEYLLYAKLPVASGNTNADPVEARIDALLAETGVDIELGRRLEQHAQRWRERRKTVDQDMAAIKKAVRSINAMQTSEERESRDLAVAVDDWRRARRQRRRDRERDYAELIELGD